MKRIHSLLLILLVALYIPAFTGCDGGCGSEAKIPAQAGDRLEDIGNRLPKSSEAVLFLTDLKETRASLNNLKGRLPDSSIVDGVTKQFQANFGIDVLDRESWKRAGIAPDSSAALGIYRSRVVFMTYVDNRQQFEKTMTDKAKSAFQIKAVTKNEKVGGHSMKVLSEDPAKQIAWTYDGKFATVVLPATSIDGALEKGTASLVLSDIAGTKKPEGLASTEGFKAFQSNDGKTYPVSLFINPGAYIKSPEFQKQAGEDPTLAAGAKWSNDNLDYLSVGFKTDKENARLHATLGMKPDLKKAAIAAAKAGAKIDWNGFATDKVLLGIRLSLEWNKVWEIFTKNMPDDERRSMLRELKKVGEGLNLDLEKDVLDQLTGNAGLFFYGIGGGMKGFSNPADIAQNAGVMLALQFKSPEAVQALTSKLMSRLAMTASLRPLSVDGETLEAWKVIEFMGQPQLGRFYLHNDMVLFATMAFSEKSVFEYASDKRSEGRLRASDNLDKGKAFAGKDAFTGIYFNAERARDNLGAFLFMMPEAKILNEIEEAALSFGVDDNGGFANLDIDLVNSGAAKKAKDDKKGDDKPAEKNAEDQPAKK